MSKTAILPIVALIAMLLKTYFHIEIGSEVQNGIADGTLALVAVWGIIKDHTKKPPTM